ncbi:MAG: FAD-dependent oxidoreductase, partial [Marivita sp.]|uniref:FAD-dependent oxidoreductase n=1 Tax=Marivita sp. TaxID=2003365 RepID=UPI003EF67D59
MNPLPGVQVTVINPGATAPYTGMLPGYVAGHYDRGDLDIDLVRLARFAGARLIAGKASAIDRDNRRITVDDRQISYDVVSVDIGITSAMPEIPGFAEHGIPAKPLDRLAAGWDGWRSTQGKAEAAVIGGGVGGVELAMAMAHALRNGGRDTRITVLETEEVLRGIGEAARDRLLAAMADLGVEIEENVSVAEVHATHV